MTKVSNGHNSSHRRPMRYNLKQSNGHNALLKSTIQKFVWKCDLNLPNMCFRLSIWLNGHRESQKYEFANWIPRTNEAAGLIVLSPNSAQNHTWFKCALLIWSRSLGRILPVEERDNRRLIVTGRNYIRWVISLIFTSKNKNLLSHFFVTIWLTWTAVCRWAWEGMRRNTIVMHASISEIPLFPR